jgi:hypothetical protein
MKNLWRRFRPGLDMLAYDQRLFGIRKALRFWLTWTLMRWNTPSAHFGPTQHEFGDLMDGEFVAPSRPIPPKGHGRRP